MYSIIGCMCAGILTGWLLRRKQFPLLAPLTTLFVWLLLFFMGTEIGNNPALLRSFPRLGKEAFILAFWSTLGSIILAGAWGWYIYKRKTK